MIEIVAKAIGAVMWTESYEGTDDRQRDMFREAARAAIEAMREPTDKMVAAGNECCPGDRDTSSFVRWIYAEMIAAALANETNSAARVDA